MCASSLAAILSVVYSAGLSCLLLSYAGFYKAIVLQLNEVWAFADSRLA